MITFTITGIGQHNEGAVSCPKYVLNVLSELALIAEETEENQNYTSPHFIINVNYVAD